MSLKIQLISDLHLEFPGTRERMPAIPFSGDVLVVAGDVGNVLEYPAIRDFLYELCDGFQIVFYVAGNHEYYYCDYNRARARLVEVCAGRDNLHFLDRSSVIYRGIRFVGCTLWSDIPPNLIGAVTRRISDYKFITTKNLDTGRVSRVSAEYLMALHRDDAAFIEEELRQAKAFDGEQKVVVVTHHAPILTGISQPKYEGSSTACAFGSDLERLIRPPVVAWLFGHTHYSTDREINGVRVVSNQMGYLDADLKAEDDVQSEFDPGFCIEVVAQQEPGGGECAGDCANSNT